MLFGRTLSSAAFLVGIDLFHGNQRVQGHGMDFKLMSPYCGGMLYSFADAESARLFSQEQCKH